MQLELVFPTTKEIQNISYGKDRKLSIGVNTASNDELSE